MAHKTLIGGTAYEIKGGRTLVNGTDYDIKAGKTLVGGTAYDVSFGEPVMVNVSLFRGAENASVAYAEVNGVKFAGTKTGLQVMSGDIIKLYGGTTLASGTPYVTINGTKTNLATGTGTIYEWQVPSGIKTASIELDTFAGVGKIIVRTSGQTSANVTITGSGHTSRCAVTINGTKYISAASGIEVQHGDSVAVIIYNESAFNVDGTQLDVADYNASLMCNWIVPSVSNIAISLSYGKSPEVGYYGMVSITTS